MDDIYDDLENYDDVNELEELRNENRQLQFKLKENQAKLNQLQKDYDKVAADLTAMQANYSSLLKTAKAEIDRKTQIITSLNAEKDMLVLSSIQNSQKSLAIIRRNMARGKSNNWKSQKEDLGSVKPNKKDVPEVKKQEPEKLSNDENRVPTPDSGSSQGQTDDTNKIVNSENKLNKEPYDKTSESKENTAKGKKALSLKHRRKSMPVLNASTISSDEEYGDGCSDNSKKERPSREDKTRNYFDRHKLIHKISETSGIDEKFSSCHESSRETVYKNRPSDKYRIPRDKSRNRKHFSPEQSRRVTRDYEKDDRELVIRHNRVLVSPPRESSDPLLQFRDRRQKYERDEDRRSRRGEFEKDRNIRKEDFYKEKLNKQRYDFREERFKKRDDSHEERARQKHAYEVKRQKQKDTFDKEKRSQRDNSQGDRNRDLYEIEKQSFERPKHKNSFEKDKHVQRYSSQEDRHNQKDASQEKKDEQKEASQEKIYKTNEDRLNPIDAKTKPKDRLNEEKQQLDRHEDRKRKERSKSHEDPHKRVRPTMSKTSIEGDEPSSKRVRIDTDSKRPEVDKKPKKQTIVEDKLLPELAKHIHHHSCQSPDNPPLDAPPVISTSNKPIEIMHTSTIYLADPRHTSKKYVKAIEGGEVVITTAKGRTVDLIPIDISTWKSLPNCKPHTLPNSDQYTDEMVQDIYMDVENPDSNLSMMSAETESNDLRMADYMTKNFQQEYENERINQIEAEADKQIEKDGHRDSINEKYVQKHNVKENESTLNPDERKLPPVRYKISRNSNIEPAPNPIGVLLQQFQSVCGVDATTKPPEPKLNVDETFGTDDDTQDKGDKFTKDKSADGRQMRRRKMSAKELVEGDLALSDDTMDNVVSQKQTKKKVKEQKFAESVKDTAKPEKINEKKTRKSKPDKKIKKEETNSNEGIEKQSDDKSHRTSRKKSVTKQIATTVTEREQPMDVEKKTKGRKPKLSTGKFPELFGDSSSLMTPEDLGMTKEAQIEKSNKYVHIFEDAQDSVDVNVGAMKRKELVITQPPVTSSKVDEPAPTAEEKQTSLICKINLPVPMPIIVENKDFAPIVVQKSTYAPGKTEHNDSTSVSVQKKEPSKSKNENIEYPVAVQKPVKSHNEHVSVQNPIEATSNKENDTVPITIQEPISAANNNDKPKPATTEHEKNDSAPVFVQKVTPNIEVSNAVEIVDPNVIKTVIISTGVQPQLEESQTGKLSDKIETIVRTTVTKITEAIPIALATSTPHKNLLHQLQTEIECNRSCTSSEQRDESSRDDRSSISNGVSTEAQNDDVPDVRIFVKRRRRLKK